MARENFDKKGFHLIEQFLSTQECENLLKSIENYRKYHTVPDIYRNVSGRSLRYRVIDGERITQNLPEIATLFQEVNKIVNDVANQKFVPLDSEKVACNINIMSKGGTYRWHYDRNAVTAILYLNEVSGGETECYPNYRIFLQSARFSKLQQWLDRLLQIEIMRRLFGKQLVCKPQTGSMLIMRGDRCLHSVRPLIGEGERINIIMSYDMPGKDFAVAAQLDDYLYSQNTTKPSDPNYF